jgi:hypothetical protein
MGDTCLPGLQGFPVQITGWSGLTDKVPLVTPNDIQLQFSPSDAVRQFNRTTGEIQQHGNSTFFMNGIQFTVRQVRLCRPKQEGLASVSGNPVAEFQIWGFPAGTVNSVLELAVLVVPVFQNPRDTVAGNNIVAAATGYGARLESCIPTGAEVVKYTTCIETSTNSTVKISIAYWTSGAQITQTTFQTLPTTLPPAGIPDIFGFRVLSSFVQFADEKKTKGQRQYQDIQSVLQPYTNSVLLSTATPEFRNAFRIIQNFQNVQKGGNKRDISSYKCVAINRERDIGDGKLLIDPSTGRRMDEEVQVAAEQKQEALGKDVPPGASARSIWMTVCIVLGVILGLGILFGIVYMISTHVLTREGAGIPPINAQTAATMAAMPEGM